jgi:putative aldouronate transport system permease protein
MKIKPDVWTILNYVVLSVLGFICLFPMWYVFVISISTGESFLADNYHFWPKAISFLEYYRALASGGIVRSLLVSFMVTTFGTIVSLLLILPSAYVLTKRFPGKYFILFMILFSMFFTIPLIPRYLLVTGLGLRNTLLSLFLPIAVSPYFLLIARNYYDGIPQSLEESARIDGANDLRIFLNIVLPVSTPIVATILMFCAIQYYNDYFNALLFISSRSLYPLQYLLREMVINNIANNTSVGGDSTYTGEIFKMACVVLAIIPPLLAYPFAQKYFVTGMTLGAVKE